jgi:hypothetical protein
MINNKRKNIKKRENHKEKEKNSKQRFQYSKMKK